MNEMKIEKSSEEQIWTKEDKEARCELNKIKAWNEFNTDFVVAFIHEAHLYQLADQLHTKSGFFYKKTDRTLQGKNTWPNFTLFTVLNSQSLRFLWLKHFKKPEKLYQWHWPSVSVWNFIQAIVIKERLTGSRL